MPAKHTIRVEDLQAWHVLEVTCGNKQCRHVGAVYAAHLQRKLAGWHHIIHITHDFKCSACGNRRENEWRVCRLPRNV